MNNLNSLHDSAPFFYFPPGSEISYATSYEESFRLSLPHTTDEKSGIRESVDPKLLLGSEDFARLREENERLAECCHKYMKERSALKHQLEAVLADV